MVSRNRILLRLHVEAVWSVQLPPIEHGEVELLPTSNVPSWKLCAAEIADGQVFIWRPAVTVAEREALLARLTEAQALPPTVVPPPGLSREVALQLTATPTIEIATAQRLTRILTPSDYALVEAFDSASAADLLQSACYPFIGVIVDSRLLSLAHSSRRTIEACELGINTLPEARRKGYALAATVAWSTAILQEGLTPIYSALAENIASLNLAQAAGYREFARVVTVE